MTIYRSFFLMLLMFGQAHAGSSIAQNYYRTFWSPTYHGARLAYCMSGDKTCGLPVAHQYCQMMGYKKADQQTIDYNVGRTQSYLDCKACKGIQCNGFTSIRCVGKLTHKPASEYYYRAHKFVFPRYHQGRVDWCYQDGKGCGKRAAYSFCRRMGYVREQHYKKQAHVSETRAIGNHKVCVGDACNAFSSITCYR